MTQSLCSGSRLVGCEERFSELGIETLSVVDVRTEAAEGEHNAASDADSFNRARLGLVERPPFAHLHASHASILFSEDLLQQSAGAKRNAHRFELGGTWNENALTGSLFCHHASGCGVSSLACQVRVPLNSHGRAGPLKSFRGFFADKAN